VRSNSVRGSLQTPSRPRQQIAVNTNRDWCRMTTDAFYQVRWRFEIRVRRSLFHVPVPLAAKEVRLSGLHTAELTDTRP
jgi:hypothetical protein